MRTAQVARKPPEASVVKIQPILALVVREEGERAIAERYTFPIIGTVDGRPYASPAPGAGKIEAGTQVCILETLRAKFTSPGHLFKGDTEHALVRVDVHPNNWYLASAFALA